MKQLQVKQQETKRKQILEAQTRQSQEKAKVKETSQKPSLSKFLFAFGYVYKNDNTVYTFI